MEFHQCITRARPPSEVAISEIWIKSPRDRPFQASSRQTLSSWARSIFAWCPSMKWGAVWKTPSPTSNSIRLITARKQRKATGKTRHTDSRLSRNRCTLSLSLKCPMKPHLTPSRPRKAWWPWTVSRRRAEEFESMVKTKRHWEGSRGVVIEVSTSRTNLEFNSYRAKRRNSSITIKIMKLTHSSWKWNESTIHLRKVRIAHTS